MTDTRYIIVDSIIGPLTLRSRGRAIVGLDFPTYRGSLPRRPDQWAEDLACPLLQEAAAQLQAYFAGTRTAFDLPLAPAGTPFQFKVWEQLGQIPFGQTISYGQLAGRVGNPAASRAVGMANGRNPIAIIIPCHRVIGADGSLTGFGGGVETKRKLLEHEGIELKPTRETRSASSLFASV